MGRVVRQGEIRLGRSSLSFTWAAAPGSKGKDLPCDDGCLVKEADSGLKLVVVDAAGGGVRATEASLDGFGRESHDALVLIVTCERRR